MTSQRPPIDDLIRELLEQRAAAGSTDGLLENILRDVSAEADRLRRPSLAPARWRAVPVYLAALLVVFVGALVIVPRIPGPATPASPSPAPSIGVLRPGGIAIDPGRYRTRVFEPPLEFTIADTGWGTIVELRRQLWLYHLFDVALPDELSHFSLVAITNVYADSCTENLSRNEPWPSTSGPAEFLDWVEANLGVELGPRTPVTIAGSSGLQVEFVAPALPACTSLFVPLSDVGLELGWQEPFAFNPAGTVTRYAVLRLSERLVLIETRTSNPARRDALWAAADEIIRSITPAP